MGKGGMRCGAGRPGYRAKAEQLQRVDIRVWRKRGYLTPGQVFSWAWTRGDERTGSIGVRVHDAHSLSLLYTVAADGERRDASQVISLIRTPCRYGSSRPWFVCPRCHRRAGLLFMRWGRFACRHCQRVAYSSQSEDAIARALRKEGKVQGRLGADWARPKGMRQITYYRLLESLFAIEEQREAAFARLLSKLFASG